jgi:hypothetical protein
MYNYYEEVKQSIEDVINDEAYYLNIEAVRPNDLEEYEEVLNDELWNEDAVTGNASGSYYCNSYKAEEALINNLSLASEALQEFGYNNIDVLDKGAEWLDVIIRCYVLPSCIAEYIEDNRLELESRLDKIQSAEE